MRINLLSSPRNVSTALMYSFAQRKDMSVIDEPFYGCYLDRHSVEHPAQEEIIATMATDIPAVFDRLDHAQQREHLFIKGMAHHVSDKDLHLFSGMVHVIFIRDPKQLIASFAQVITNPTMRDIGVRVQSELYSKLHDMGERVIVLDSGILLDAPEAVLRELCQQIGLVWDARMLSWPSGPRPEDGVWEKHWYSNVHRTTGFSKQATSSRELPSTCEALYEESLPLYQELRSHSIRLPLT